MASQGRQVGRPPKHEGLLAHWIKRHSLTRAIVASRLGISRKYLDHLCREQRRPSLELASKIERLTDGEINGAYLAKLPKYSR